MPRDLLVQTLNWLKNPFLAIVLHLSLPMFRVIFSRALWAFGLYLYLVLICVFLLVVYPFSGFQTSCIPASEIKTTYLIPSTSFTIILAGLLVFCWAPLSDVVSLSIISSMPCITCPLSRRVCSNLLLSDHEIS